MAKESVRSKETETVGRVPPDRLERIVTGATEFLRGYFWFVFKNVMGWLLIFSAVPVGILVPGPGGLPMFLIGFALVTFPGKRQLTSRVMSGRGLPIDAGVFTVLTAILAIGVTIALLWILGDRLEHILAHFNLSLDQTKAAYTAAPLAFVVIGLIALLTTWIATRVGLQVVNFFLRRAPKIRRWIRPKMRQWGIDILPARRKHASEGTKEIIEISPEYQSRFMGIWQLLRPWLKRMFSLGITFEIFREMISKLSPHWPKVRDKLGDVSFIRFVIASFMFAAFLFVFRALVWHRILTAFGKKLPVKPMLRIWTTSELARYLPLSVWQMVGRAFLARPYGVTAAVCSTTQVLELCIFLLANLLVALSCLFYFGAKVNPHFRMWMYVAMTAVPMLALLLHPKVFYSVTNFVLRRLKKTPIVQRLSGQSLIQLLGWTLLGLAWQTLAIYVIAQPLLQLKIDWIWIIAGAYCLSWCAGFMAFWASGGLGVRELVLWGALGAALPAAVQSRAEYDGMVVLVPFILRAWTIAGELILSIIAYALDMRGALGDPKAPGREPTARQLSGTEAV